MDVRLKTTDYEMPTEVATYLDGKLAMIEKLVTDDASRCEVDLGRSAGHPQQGKIWKAEIVLHHFGERMRAIAEEESVKAAIDIVKDEIMTLLKKNRGKKTTTLRRAGAQLKKFARRGDMRSY
jgi:ribosome-associated translation inhibitor RaiA